MHLQSLSGVWQFRPAGTEEWLPAKVPSSVHTDLLAGGQLPSLVRCPQGGRWRWRARRSRSAPSTTPMRTVLWLDRRASLTLRHLVPSRAVINWFRVTVRSLVNPESTPVRSVAGSFRQPASPNPGHPAPRSCRRKQAGG